jgi:diguanylate cyclase (GGDEF)-like protein
MNRRALEDRFTELRAQGFAALAVLDLDRFKAINDEFGHGVGDDVLKAAAAAIESDANLLAFRLGGEEFVLLLKGRNALAEAERRRQAITIQVARRIDALDRPVTASMGVIEMPPDAAPDADFEYLYARADKLLYEAKQGGRNRTVSERLKLFVPRQSERRKAAA